MKSYQNFSGGWANCSTMFRFQLKLRRTRDLSESRQPAKIINSGEIVIFLAAKMSKAKLQNSGEIVDFNGENVSKLSQKHTFKLS